jgi:arginine decarboxylase
LSLGEIKIPPPEEGEVNKINKIVRELYYTLQNINSKNFNEYYHDAVEFYEDLFTLFDLGYVNLQERAVAESLFHKICLKTLNYASRQKRTLEEFEFLQKLKVSKYLANFSIFQSIPDSWSIDQLFPVLPLSRHSEKPTQRGKIVDITCDSDGCLERFIDSSMEKSVLELHKPNGASYYLGFFLVGAYQESLANEHNLFGAIHEVEVSLDDKSHWEITKITKGDPIKELLVCRNYEVEELEQSYRDQLKIAVSDKLISKKRSKEIAEILENYLGAYPYLKEKSKKTF